MNIWIESAALKGTDDNNSLLNSGVLYSLVRLSELGHKVGFSTDDLSVKQLNLLKNEGIEPEFATPAYAETSVELSVKATKEEEDDTEQAYKLQFTNNDTVITESENWVELVRKICFPERRASIERNTSETDITVEINLDGSGKSEINTGLGFLDHMMEQIAKHALLDLRLSCEGDLNVDEHHTIEDTAITLGKALDKALGDKTGIQRYGFILPMDESRAYAALDLSGRPYLKFDGSFNREMVGEFPTEMVEHFFYSLVINLNATLHIRVEGENDHHKIEACFKAFARSLRSCITRSERNLNILPSTKDLL